MNRLGARNIEKEPDMRPYQESGDYITEDQGLLESLGNYGKYTCGDENHRKIAHKIEFVRHLFAVSNEFYRA